VLFITVLLSKSAPSDCSLPLLTGVIVWVKLGPVCACVKLNGEENSGQKTENRRQRIEDRKQRTEGRPI
jgi:hypothetical protein